MNDLAENPSTGPSRVSGDRVTRSKSTKRALVPVLMYHALGDNRSVITISPRVFAWQIQWLYEHDFRGLSVSRLVQHLRSGDPLPERTVAITFDDGFESVYIAALPVLMRYGFPATVFLVAEYCGRQNDWPDQPLGIPRLPLLTWSQIEEMERLGIEFGAHGISHLRLDHLSPERLAHEVLGSKVRIEEYLGHAITLFSYPYGRYNTAVKALVRETYVGACTAEPGIVTRGSDPWALARIDAHYLAPAWIFRQLAYPTFPVYLGLRRVLRTAASFVLRRTWQ